jgi:tRNA(fMet)-specific endonuclease VapC
VICPVDISLINKWAEIVAQSEKAGRHIDSKDAWIAATALVLKLPLVTHNRKHFEKITNLHIISHQKEKVD